MSITPGDTSALLTKKYVMCYFDIIGTTHFLSVNPNLVYSYLWGISHSLDQYKNNDDSIIIKCFSDNYIVMIESDESNKNMALQKLSTLVGHVSADCLTMFGGYPRGVITYGELHYSPDCVIGPALVKAYKMEQNCCLFPRIIVDEDTFSFDPNENLELSTDKLYLKDCDGRVSLNSLACISKEELKALLPFLLSDLLKNASDSSCKSDPGIFVKYEWLINYVTKFLNISGL